MQTQELGARLRQLRERVGLSLSEASGKLGFAHYQTLAEIEKGNREVKAAELASFSKIYYCHISSLLGLDEAETTEPVFCWRQQPAKNARLRIEAKITHKCRQYHLLEKLLGIVPETKLSPLTNHQIANRHSVEQAGEQCAQTLGLGRRPAFTLQRVLEEDFGVKVLYEQMDSGSAVASRIDGCGSVIVINANDAPWRRNFDLAHELFHLLTWDAVPAGTWDDPASFAEIERKADIFAASLLLPTNEIKAVIDNLIARQKKVMVSDVVDIALEFGVSTVALLYRMVSLRYIEFDKVQAIMDSHDMKSIDRRKRQQLDHDEPKSERMESLAVRCLRKGHLSRGKFAEIMGIDRSEIDSFINELGMLDHEGATIEIMAS
mgnify:CR=1 FL=1